MADVGLIFVLSRILFALAAGIATQILPEAQHDAVVHSQAPGWIDAVWRWDSVHYYRIAAEGYTGKNAFFPLLPLLLRGVSIGLTGSTAQPQPAIYMAPDYGLLLAGIILPNIFFLFAALVIYRLVRSAESRAVARRTILYLSFAPLAVYFAVPYTEALFLATTAACFLMLRQKRWVWAGLCGFLATLTRQVGLLLILPMLYELWLAFRVKTLTRREIAAGAMGLALPFAGIGLFMLVLAQASGDPLAFLHAQDDWQRRFSTPPQTIWQGLSDLMRPYTGDAEKYWVILLHTFLTLGSLLVILFSIKRWRPSYTLYTVASLVLILSSHLPSPLVFNSMGRYTLVLFPIFISMAQWGRRRWIHWAIMVVSLSLFVVCTALYVRWYPVG